MKSTETSLVEMFNTHFQKKKETHTQNLSSLQCETSLPLELNKDKNDLIPSKGAQISDLKKSIEMCEAKLQLVQLFSVEHKWLLNNIVTLKLRLFNKELSENESAHSNNELISEIGLKHIFEKKYIIKRPQSNLMCDHCGKVISIIGLNLLICKNCSMTIHKSCLHEVTQSCVEIPDTEKIFEERICPEIGLAKQKYRCADCLVSLITDRKLAECRLCDYSGLRYCMKCHWNDTFIIPARIIQNWDFRPYKVAKVSLIKLKLLYEESSINLNCLNPSLFDFATILSANQKLRDDICMMHKYLSSCRLAIETNTLEIACSGSQISWLQSPELYSMADLVSINNGRQNAVLNRIYASCYSHIKCCELCSGRGYICGICKTEDILFPFDVRAKACTICNLLYHRDCFPNDNVSCKKCGMK